jgi:hypothetical protein
VKTVSHTKLYTEIAVKIVREADFSKEVLGLPSNVLAFHDRIAVETPFNIDGSPQNGTPPERP